MAIREPFEPPSVSDWALIIHAEATGDRVDVYWVDLNAGREGLRLASEVKAWRRRDDLLTIGHRLRIAPPLPAPVEGPEPEEPPAPVEPAAPVEGPVSPVEARNPSERIDARHDYLAGRVRALVAHSTVAAQALQRGWPVGVSGLKNDGQSWEQLDAITEAVELVEKHYSVPFYPEFVDPTVELAKREHPSNIWARPQNSSPATVEDKETVQTLMMAHPRSALMRTWIGYAISGGIDHKIDTTALAHALFEFGSLDVEEWPDEDLTTMLDGSLRAIGYENGCLDLGRFNPAHAPLLMSAAFAITAGNAYLLFDDDGKPVVRTNVRKG